MSFLSGEIPFKSLYVKHVICILCGWSPSRCFTRKGFTIFGGFPGVWYHRQAVQGCRGFPYDSIHSLGWLNLLLLGIVTMDWSLGWGLTSLKGRVLYPNHPLDKGMQERGFRKAEMSLNFSAFPFNSKSTNSESLFWLFLMFLFSQKWKQSSGTGKPTIWRVHN